VTVAPPRLAIAAPAGTPTIVRVRVTDVAGAHVVEIPLEQYVLGAVRAELSPDTLRDEAVIGMIEVQALVSRTYALANRHRHAGEGFDLCDTTHCQVYRPPPAAGGGADPASRAVDATRGQVITFEGRVIQALFHANCGGYTASAASVWGGVDEPYLQPVPDWFCSRTSPAEWTYAAVEADLARALAANPAVDVGPRVQQIEVTGRDAAGRALEVRLTGDRTATVRAEAFRTVMRQAFGDRSVRSTRFTVERDGDRFVFTGSGSGHGVGLCQAGALQRIRAGLSPAEIIGHYFPGTRIQPASDAVPPMVPGP
jgi:stage II sporulation protein D